MSAAPENLSASRRLVALGAVALAAFGIALAARESGALAPLEREALKARFDVRGAEPVKGLLVVGIDAKTFGELEQQWPFPRSLHGQVVRRLHAAGAREIVYDVQFTEPTRPREDLALFDAIDDAGGAVLATSESDDDGSTNVLGGDDNLRSIGARAAASDLRNDTSGAIANFPRAAGKLDSIAVVTAERLQGHPPPADGFRDGKAWIDFRGPPGTIPTVSFVGCGQGARAREHDPRPHRGRGRHRADAARRALDAGGRRGADARRRGPGERDLDRAARPAAALGAGRRGHPPAGSARHARAAHALASPAGSGRRRDGRGGRGLPRGRPVPVRERQHRRRGRAARGAPDRRLRGDRLERARRTPRCAIA